MTTDSPDVVARLKARIDHFNQASVQFERVAYDKNDAALDTDAIGELARLRTPSPDADARARGMTPEERAERLRKQYAGDRLFYETVLKTIRQAEKDATAERDRRIAELEAELAEERRQMNIARGRFNFEINTRKALEAEVARLTKELETAVEEEREACAKVCDDRAAYFDRTTGHYDREQAALSYRATAKEVRSRITPRSRATSSREADHG